MATGYRIAPQGVIQGHSISGGFSDTTGRYLGSRDLHALVLLDDMLFHVQTTHVLGQSGSPWVVNPTRTDKFIAQSKYPAPLELTADTQNYGVKGLQTLIVGENGSVRRWVYDNVTWHEAEFLMMGGAVGAPSLFSGRDDTLGIVTTYQAFIPMDIGIWHMSFAPEYGIWFPRGLPVEGKTGWPTGLKSVRNSLELYYPVDGTLYFIAYNMNEYFVGWGNPQPVCPCSYESAAALETLPRFKEGSFFPLLPGDTIVLAHDKAKGGLVHWQKDAETWTWKEIKALGDSTGGPAMTKPYELPFQNRYNLFVLAPRDRDMYRWQCSADPDPIWTGADNIGI